MTQGELVRLFAEEAGVEPKMSTMGKLMMSLGGLFIPEAKESVEMMYDSLSWLFACYSPSPCFGY